MVDEKQAEPALKKPDAQEVKAQPQFKWLSSLEERDTVKKDVREIVEDIQRLSPNKALIGQANDAEAKITSLLAETQSAPEGKIQELGVSVEEQISTLGKLVSVAMIGRMHELHTEKEDLRDRVERRSDFKLSDAAIGKCQSRIAEIERELKAFEPSEEEQKVIDSQAQQYQREAERVLAPLRLILELENQAAGKMDQVREESSRSSDSYFKECDPLKGERSALRKELEAGTADEKRKDEIEKRIGELTVKIDALSREHGSRMDTFIEEMGILETDLQGIKSQAEAESKKVNGQLSAVSASVYEGKKLPTEPECFAVQRPLEIAQSRVELVMGKILSDIQLTSFVRSQAASAKEEETIKEEKKKEEEEAGRQEAAA